MISNKEDLKEKRERLNIKTWLIGSPAILAVEITPVVEGDIWDCDGVIALLTTLSLCVFDIDKIL